MPTSSAIYQVDRSVDLPSHPKSLLHQHAPILSSIYSDTNIIKIIELTVPFETNIEKEHTFKTNKYATLIQDIKDKQISSELTCVAVGCRGYVSESNKIRITTMLKSLDIQVIQPSKRQVKELTLSLSKLALLTSFVIFKCKDELEWFDCGVKTATVWPWYDTWHLITFSMFTRYSHRLLTWLHWSFSHFSFTLAW